MTTPTVPDSRSIGIIGTGRLAASLAAALLEAGYPVVAIAGRDAATSEALATRLGSGVLAVPTPTEVLGRAQVVFLAVPDSTVGPLAAVLPWHADHWAVHCSGAVRLDALRPVVDAGGVAGCLHPLQSFPSRGPEPQRFQHVTCGVEAAEPLGAYLEQIAQRVGARSVRLEGIDRARYHAAAVFASNYAVALMRLAERTWTSAGLPEDAGREALAPLLAAVAENVGRLDLAAALTGPIARGDVSTVEAHLAALEALPDVARTYRMLGAELLSLPIPLPEDARRALEDLLR